MISNYIESTDICKKKLAIPPNITLNSSSDEPIIMIYTIIPELTNGKKVGYCIIDNNVDRLFGDYSKKLSTRFSEYYDSIIVDNRSDINKNELDNNLLAHYEHSRIVQENLEKITNVQDLIDYCLQEKNINVSRFLKSNNELPPKLTLKQWLIIYDNQPFIKDYVLEIIDNLPAGDAYNDLPILGINQQHYTTDFILKLINIGCTIDDQLLEIWKTKMEYVLLTKEEWENISWQDIYEMGIQHDTYEEYIEYEKDIQYNECTIYKNLYDTYVSKK